MPLLRMLSYSASNPGKCVLLHVGVNAPGSANMATHLSENISCDVRSYHINPGSVSISFLVLKTTSGTIISNAIVFLLWGVKHIFI